MYVFVYVYVYVYVYLHASGPNSSRDLQVSRLLSPRLVSLLVSRRRRCSATWRQG